MITQAYLEFVEKLQKVNSNYELLELYKYYLNKYDDFKRYSFIVGTNDKTGAVDNPLIRKYRHEPNQATLYSIKNGLKETSQTMDLFTIDILNSYKYFMVLRSDFKEGFKVSLNMTLDTNIASFIIKFIKNNEIDTNVFRSKDELLFFEPFIQDILQDRVADIDIFHYITETLSKQYDNTNFKLDRLYSNIESLCKFKSLDIEHFNQTGILKYDVKHFKNMYDFFRNNLNDFVVNIDYNYIYSYVVLAIISQNSKDFDIKKSIKHIFDYMQENGTNFSELLEFILDYFEKNRNQFIKIDLNLNNLDYKTVIKNIKNMCWDIASYYSMRKVFGLTSYIDEDFIFPIYASMDAKFVNNYITLFENRAIVYKDNKFIGIVRQESELTKRLKYYIGNPTKDFQRDKILNLEDNIRNSIKLVNVSEEYLKSYINRIKIENTSNLQKILYHIKDSDLKINVVLKNNDIWVTEEGLSRLFEVDSYIIKDNLDYIFKSKELDEMMVVSKIELIDDENGDNSKLITNFYNLDAIISVGYRINSARATQFRIWANNVLKSYIIKGFAINEEQLKQSNQIFGKDYFKELLDTIRSIRASERRIWQQITDIFAECSIDYDKNAEITKYFYALVQNKFHYAITGQTAAEIIYNKADSTKEYMGLSTWKNAPNGRILKLDTKVAKNYLSEKEIKQLERAVSGYFDYIEDLVERENTFTMEDFVASIDEFLNFRKYKILKDNGKISHQTAIQKAQTEYDIFNKTQKIQSDFDKSIAKLTRKKS